ncbi:MAG: hypothetical protein F6K58_24815 [Symploca sp. SIO2E9]|nr:hypothetical protein [Symploca sp. SIO2E9]
MKKNRLLVFLTIFSLGIVSTSCAETQTEQTQTEQTQTEQAQTAPTQNAWDALEAAHVIGAMDWCTDNTPQNPAYQSLRDKASGLLDDFIASEDITSGEAFLVQQRAKEQGRALGIELNQQVCANLESTVVESPSWEMVTSVEGDFTIELPGIPEIDETVDNIEGTEFNWTTYESAVKAESNPRLEKGEFYMLAYADLPADYIANNSQDAIFKSVSKYIFEQMGLSELKEEEADATTDGIPLKIFSGDGYGQSVATIMYIVDQRFYFNLVVATEEEHFQRFLRSFEVLDL